MMKNLLSLDIISIYQFSKLLDLTLEIKENPEHFKDSLSGLIVAGVFQNPSFHPSVSFQAAAASLNGKFLLLKSTDLQTGQNKLSSIDCQCLEKWVDGILMEIKNHKRIVEMGERVKIPMINAGSESFVPCQALADFVTIKEQYKDLTNIKLALIGNQRNLSHSLLLASATAGTYIHIAATKGYHPDPKVINKAEKKGRDTGFKYKITENPREAALNADIIYYSGTSPNSSIEKKEFLFKDQILPSSKKDTLFMFGIPSEEWENDCFDKIPSHQSLIFSQADNRLHIKKAIMVSLIKENKREM